jgi:Ca2+:H+ antiporter
MSAVLRFRFRPLDALLIAVPLAVVLRFSGAGAVWVFVVSCAAVVPLAALMGEATEILAERLGPGAGGLLNATFGNAAELILALMALADGKHDLVKASLTGSIIGNLLLVLGLAILAGGLFHRRQTFNRTAAGLGATLLALACIGLLIPTLFHHLARSRPAPAEASAVLANLSEEIAVVLAGVYLLSLLFTLHTHRHLFAGPECAEPARHDSRWSTGGSFIVLLVATAGVALVSEFLVGAVEPAAEALGMSEAFVGVVIVAVVGNAAEHSTAVLVAMKDQMDLAVTVAVGSSIQVALFVAPVLVFASLLTSGPVMDLHFTPMETAAVLIAIAVTALVCQDGETHWMEGVLLLAVYAILALAFFHLPATGERW